MDLQDKIKLEKGMIEGLGGRMVLVHASVLHDLTMRMQQSFGDIVWEVFYDYSKRSAVQHAKVFFSSDYAVKYLTENNLTAHQVFEEVVKLLEFYGHGTVKIADNNLPDSEATVVLENSAVASFIKEKRHLSSKPTCFYTAGFLAGFAAVLYGKDFDCKEEKCLASHNNECVFKIFPASEQFQRMFMKEKGISISR